MRTSNPTLNEKTFRVDYTGTNTMTVGGTVNKTFILLLVLTMTFIWSWKKVISFGDTAAMMPWMIGGAIVGLIFALVTAFAPKASPFTAPLYALAEGVFLGAFSAFMELQYPGIAFQAALLTFATLFAMLGAYKAGLIKVTEKFRTGVMAATGAIFLIYMATFILGFFGIHMPFLHDNSPLGIGISLVIIAIAALNLVLDFDFIDRGAAQGAPKYMEWYGAFGLLVTLVWLYIEFLRLLSKLRSR